MSATSSLEYRVLGFCCFGLLPEGRTVVFKLLGSKEIDRMSMGVCNYFIKVTM